MNSTSSEPDHYATLGVSPSANSGEIRDAFVTLIRKHRDQPGETKVEVVERARQINIAYDKLSNPSQRRAYDESRGIFFAPPAGRAPPTAAGNDDYLVADETHVAPVGRSDERAAESRAAATERAAAERAAAEKRDAAERDAERRDAEKRDAEKRDAGRSLPIGAGLVGAGIAGAGMAGAVGAGSDRGTVADDSLASVSGQREDVAHEDHGGHSRYEDDPGADGRRSPWGKVSLVAGGLVAAGALAMLLPGLGSTPDAVSDAEVARSDGVAVAGRAAATGGDGVLAPTQVDQMASGAEPGMTDGMAPVAESGTGPGAGTGPDAETGAYYPSAATAPTRVAVTEGDALPNRPSSAEARTRTPAAAPAEREAAAAPAEVAAAANVRDAPAEAPAASAPAPERTERVAARSAVPTIGTYAKWVSGELVEKDNPGGRLKGTVNVRFTVERNGRTTDCRPVGGSANAALGSITCQLIEQRVKFTPALDSAGQPISSELRTSHTWGRRSRR